MRSLRALLESIDNQLRIVIERKLDKEVLELDGNTKKQYKENMKSDDPKKATNNIPIAVIALMYTYRKIAGEHEGITLKNKNVIAKEHGYTAKTSGKQLHDDFKKYFLKKSNRIKSRLAPDALGYEQSMKNIIKNLTKAINELASYPNALDIAKKELEEVDA